MKMRLTAALLAALLTAPAIAAEYTVGVSRHTYSSDRLESTWSAEATAGNTMFMWASFEATDFQMADQSVGNVDLWGVGAGIRADLAPGLRVWARAGYFHPSLDTNPAIRQEAVTAVLRADHGPVPFHPQYSEISWEAGWGGAVGADFQVGDRFLISPGIRYVSLEEQYDIWRGPVDAREPACGCWWQGIRHVKLTAYSVTASVRF